MAIVNQYVCTVQKSSPLPWPLLFRRRLSILASIFAVVKGEFSQRDRIVAGLCPPRVLADSFSQGQMLKLSYMAANDIPNDGCRAEDGVGVLGGFSLDGCLAHGRGRLRNRIQDRKLSLDSEHAYGGSQYVDITYWS